MIIGDDINWGDLGCYGTHLSKHRILMLLQRIDCFSTMHSSLPVPVAQAGQASAFSLKSSLKKGELDSLQLDAYIKPRPAEEFYDNRKDPLQQHNLIHDRNYAGMIDSLTKILNEWREHTGDTYPSVPTPHWYDRETGDSLSATGTRGEMPGAARRVDTIHAKGLF